MNKLVAPIVAPPLDARQALQEDDTALHPWLHSLQGNILRGHGREYSVFLCLKLPENRQAARAAIRWMATEYSTSALTQYLDAKTFKKLGLPGKIFGSVLLSADGYERLGLSLGAFFTAGAAKDDPNAPLFTRGMKNTVTELSDPPVGDWDAHYKTTIDAVLVLADSDEAHLSRTAGEAAGALASLGVDVLAAEHGRVRRNNKREGIEHFGFVDGRSQPLYLRSDFDPTNPALDGQGEATDVWSPFEPLKRVLVPDPGVEGGQCHGSFVVLRKLEQDVAGFQDWLEEQAVELRVPGADGAARVGAMVVGRDEAGTPLATVPEGSHQANNFRFDDDPRGARCPLHGHIRKVNPRGRTVHATRSEEDERAHRITRRSITYGRRDDTQPPPSKGVGVLFVCYQASIEDQFAFMQRNWCNNAAFPQAGVGVDALVGQTDPRQPGASRTHFWPTLDDPELRRIATSRNFVTMKGGEYFFAPSRKFLVELE